MNFEQAVDIDRVCKEFEESIRIGNEGKAQECFLKLLEKKINLKIDIEEKPKTKIEQPKPQSNFPNINLANINSQYKEGNQNISK